MNIGVDTLHLHCKQWKVLPSAQIEVQPAPFEVGTGKPIEERPDCELFNGVRGVKAFANRPLWNLTIRPYRGTVNAFVALSVPKVHTGGRNNYSPVPPEGYSAVLGLVESELFAAGFDCDIQSANLSRVDVFRNIATTEPFEAYGQVFGLMNAKRMHLRQFGSTFLWANKQHALTTYNKREELEAAGVSIEGVPANAVRFEYRVLTGRKCEAAIPFRTAGELLGGLDVLGALYRNAWASQAFALEVADVESYAKEQALQEMRFYRAQFGRMWVAKHLHAMGALQVHRTIGAKRYGELVREVEADSAVAATSARKARFAAAAVRESAALLGTQRKQRKGVTLGALYRELRGAVLA